MDIREVDPYDQSGIIKLGEAGARRNFEKLDIDPDMYLCDHFQYKELIYSDTAIAKGIDNRVCIGREDIIDNAKYLGRMVLDPLRKKFGPFRPNSWYRGEELEFNIANSGFATFIKKSIVNDRDEQQLLVELRNCNKSLLELIARAQTSTLSNNLLSLWDLYFARKQHPNGEAADIRIARAGSVSELYAHCKSMKVPYDQLILEFHKPAVPQSGWVHYSIIEEARHQDRRNRYSAFSIN